MAKSIKNKRQVKKKKEKEENSEAPPGGNGTTLESLSNAILLRIFQKLDGKELMKLCGVCTRWKGVIAENRKALGINAVFKVNGSPVSLAMFNALTLPWKRFHFEGFDLEAELLGKEKVFQRFSVAYAPRITSLSIDNCELPTGRLFELLAFCKDLQKLSLKNLPSIYKLNLGIFRWGFCYKSLQTNLANISQLVLVDKCIGEQDLMGLVNDMIRLRTLHIITEQGYLPVHAIGKILLKNGDTLRHLTLKGPVHPNSSSEEGLFPQSLPEMKQMNFINLLKTKMEDSSHVDMLRLFLSKCTNLTGLRIRQARIEHDTLSSVLRTLSFLELDGCAFGSNVFATADLSNLVILKINQTNPTLFNGTSKGALSTLLSLYKPKLTLFEAKSIFDTSILASLTKQNSPVLRSIYLQECIDLGGPQLRRLFSNFEGLSELSIISSNDIDDDALCPSMFFPGNLSKLPNLVSLDLSGTSCGDKAIAECVVGKMKKLKRLTLKNTKVTPAMVVPIVQGLPKLLDLYLTCEVHLEVIKKVAAGAPHVTIHCPAITPKDGVVDVGTP